MGAMPNLQLHSIASFRICSLSSHSSAMFVRTFPFSNSFANFIWAPTPAKLKCRKQTRRTILHSPKAASSEEGETKKAKPTYAEFEERLARIQRKGRGTGKKAEMRKLRKAGMDPSNVKSRKTGILLPPIPLKDPISGGLKVEFGFNSYSERLNGRFAALGLAALLLVELASGKSLIKYHAPGTLILQTYFVLAMSTLFVKYEKEKISIWPKSKP